MNSVYNVFIENWVGDGESRTELVAAFSSYEAADAFLKSLEYHNGGACYRESLRVGKFEDGNKEEFRQWTYSRGWGDTAFVQETPLDRACISELDGCEPIVGAVWSESVIA